MAKVNCTFYADKKITVDIKKNFPEEDINLSQRHDLNEIPNRIENVLKRQLLFFSICIKIVNSFSPVMFQFVPMNNFCILTIN